MEEEFGTRPEAVELAEIAGGCFQQRKEMLVQFGRVGGGRIAQFAPLDPVPE